MKSKQKQLAEALYSLLGETKEKGERKKIIASFVVILAKKNILGLAPKIYKELEKLDKEARGVLEAEVILAGEMEEKERKKIISWMEKHFNKKEDLIEADFSVDKSLIGGAVIKTKDRSIDFSVKRKLNALRADLVTAKRDTRSREV